MHYRRIIIPLAFLKSQKDERNSIALPLLVFRQTDPEEKVFNVTNLNYCLHTYEKAEKSCTLYMV